MRGSESDHFFCSLLVTERRWPANGSTEAVGAGRSDAEDEATWLLPLRSPLLGLPSAFVLEKSGALPHPCTGPVLAAPLHLLGRVTDCRKRCGTGENQLSLATHLHVVYLPTITLRLFYSLRLIPRVVA